MVGVDDQFRTVQVATPPPRTQVDGEKLTISYTIIPFSRV